MLPEHLLYFVSDKGKDLYSKTKNSNCHGTCGGLICRELKIVLLQFPQLSIFSDNWLSGSEN